MTRKHITSIIESIQQAADSGDDESAHGLEDKLRLDFLQAVANRIYPPDVVAPLAAYVLTTSNIQFARWCA